MKKIIIAALLATSSTYTFAEDFFTISGKKVSLHEQRFSMIAKFGKPTGTSVMGVNWTIGNKSLSAGFDKWGLNTLDTGNGSFTVDGKTITIGKDTLNTIKTKIQNYCYQSGSDIAGKDERLTARVGAEGEIYIVFTAFTTDRKVSDKAINNIPISTLKLSYEDPLSNPTCNY